MGRKQSIQKVIDVTQSLKVGDVVHFTDYRSVTYVGEIIEKQKRDNHTDWIVKSADNKPDSVLELWFDSEGGPIHVQVSFESQEPGEVKYIGKV